MLTLQGHLDTQHTLATLIGSNTMPHAILLHGYKGIGKRLMAEHMAKRLICGADTAYPKNTLSYNESSLFHAQIEAGSTRDYHILTPIDGKKTISIDQIRTLLSTLTLSSDHPRTIIIDSADTLTPEAQNALLKTLEEPLTNTYFILVCHQLSALLPTLVSRCRLMHLAPLSNDITENIIAHQLPEYSKKDIENLTHLSNGSPGQALAMANNKLLDIHNTLHDYLNSSGTPSPVAIAEKCQKLAPEALNLLTTLLSDMTKQNSATASRLQPIIVSLQQGKKECAELNLSAHWLLEHSLRTAKNELSQTT